MHITYQITWGRLPNALIQLQVCNLKKLKSISIPFHPNLKLQLSPTILLCSVWANEIRALCAATLHPQMSRAAARRSCMLAAAEFYPDSGSVATSLTGPLVELGRRGRSVGQTDNND